MDNLIVVVLLGVAGYLLFVYSKDLFPPAEPEVEDMPEPTGPTLQITEKRLFHESPYTGVRLDHREEHTFIVAASGHGKSWLLKSLIADDMEQVHRGDATVIVIDSQSTLINDLLSYEPMCSPRTILIDPEDYDHPFSMHPVTAGVSGSARDKAAAQMHTVSMLDYMFSSQEAEFTQKQRQLFTYMVQLLTVIPNATFSTMREIMQPDGLMKYQHCLDRLSEQAQTFFNDKTAGFLSSKEYGETKNQVTRRLDGLLGFDYFARMFSDPPGRFDWHTAIDDGSLILINTDSALFQDNATFFGKYALASIFQAAEQRKDRRKPIYLYIDETDDLIDRKLELIFQRARKLNLCLTIAVQDLTQLQKLGSLNIVMGNTAHKFAGELSSSDATRLLGDFHLGTQDKGWFMNAPKGKFYVRSRYPCVHMVEWTYYEPSLEDYTSEDITVAKAQRMIEADHPLHTTALSQFVLCARKAGYTNNVIASLEDKVPKSTRDQRQRLKERMRQLYAVQPKLTTPHETTALKEDTAPSKADASQENETEEAIKPLRLKK